MEKINIPTQYQKKFEDTLTFEQVTTVLKLYPELYHRVIQDVVYIDKLFQEQNPNVNYDWETSMLGSLDNTYSSKTNKSFEKLELLFTNNTIDEIEATVNQSSLLNQIETKLLKSVKNILNDKND